MRARTARVSLDSVEADTILAGALRILEARAHYGNALTSPAAVRDYLKLAIASRGRAPVPRSGLPPPPGSRRREANSAREAGQGNRR